MKSFLPIVLRVLGLACLVASADAGDWPAYRHDARRSNITEEKLAFPLREIWRHVPAQAPRPAWPEPLHIINRLDFDYAPHPVTGGGMVFISSTSEDSVAALDMKTGAARWRFVTGGPVRFPPQFSEGRVFAGSDDGFVYCLDAATGAVVWKFRAGPSEDLLVGNGRMISRWPVRTGVLVMDGTVYFAAGMWNAEGVHVCALKADTGVVVWRNDTSAFISVDFKGTMDPAQAESILSNPTHQGEFGATGNTPQGAPLASGDTLLIPNGIGFPSRFDRRTGEYLAWEKTYAPFPGTGGALGGTWGCIDGKNYYTFGKHRSDILGIAGFSIEETAVAGLRSAGPAPQVNIMPPAAGSKYRPKDYIHDKGKVSAVVVNGKAHARHAYGLAMAGDALIVGLDAAVIAEDPQTKKELWRAPVDGIAREIAIADGRLLVGTDRGVIHCFNSGSGVAAPTIHVPAPAVQSRATTASARVIEQVRAAGMDGGFALVIGESDAALSLALASATRLSVVHVVPDEGAAAPLRERLAATGLGGSRIQVVAVPQTDRLPFARYFANAIVIAGPTRGLAGRELYRVLRPCGGILLTPGLQPAEAAALLAESGAPAEEVRKEDGALVRGRLPGALDWDKAVPSDRVTGGPMRVLWFGGPETMQTQNYQQNLSNQPVIANGRYFVMGERLLTAVDAYNGTVLWARAIPRKYPNFLDVDGVLHSVEEQAAPEKTGTGRTIRVGGADRIYLCLGKSCWRDKEEVWIEVDARTGEQLNVVGEWTPPPIVSLKKPQSWPIEVDAAHSGKVTLESSAEGLVVTLITKDPAVAPLDAWDLYVDLRPAEKRSGLYERGAFHIGITPARNASTPAAWSKGTGAIHPQPRVAGERTSDGTRTTVTFPWAEIEKITGIRPSSFGFAATLNSHDGDDDGRIVRRHLFGDRMADALNNGWANVFTGEAPASMEPPSIIAPLTRDFRKTIFGLNPNRAQVVDDPVALGPRIHPLTGELEPKIFRTGTGGCGAPYYSSTSRYGRATGMLGLYDFVDDSGLRNFCGIKAGCSTQMIAALGLLIIPPEGDHCVCTFPFQTTVTMAPADQRLNEDWAIFHDRPADTLIRQGAINLGAIGDRRDDQGTLWLGFPRSPEQGPGYSLAAGTSKAAAPSGVWMRHMSPGLQVPLDIEYQDPARSPKPEDDVLNMNRMWTFWMPNRLRKEFGPHRVNTDIVRIEGTTRPWIYGSGIRGIRKAAFKLDLRQPLATSATSKPPTLDGTIAPSEWGEKANSTLPFTKTEVFLRHDDRNLYVAMKRPAVTNRLGTIIAWKKDATGGDAAVWDDDSWEVFLGDNDSGKVVHLGVSASGARHDALCNDASAKAGDSSWNGAWTSAVTANESGLCIEMAIPWKTLTDAGLQKDRVGINFQSNQKDVSSEVLRFPGGVGRDWKSKETSSEALTYLGLEGRARCRNFTPLGLGIAPTIQPRPFTVRLHFAELDDVKPGERMFDVTLQGQVVEKSLDVVTAAGGPRKALVREFPHVLAGETLTVEFTSAAGNATRRTTPILSGLEFTEEGFTPPVIAQKPKSE
jgi:outer membrane protein assembly factor BamB